MQLSPHFTYEELTASQTALRRGIDNTPDEAQIDNLRNLCERVLEPIREIVDAPVIITSGYRCIALNAAVGGKPMSQHLTGQAADFVVPGWTARAICHRLANQVSMGRIIVLFDQLIEEGTWTHVSWSPEPRGSVLTATFTKSGVEYSEGLA